MANALALPQTVEKALVKIEEIVDNDEYGALTRGTGKARLGDAIRLSHYRDLIAQQMTPEIMQLAVTQQGTSGAFAVDRKYNAEELKPAMLDALQVGLMWSGDEFAVIKGKMMPVKNGIRRLVNEFPGVKDVKLEVSEPIVKGTKAKCTCTIKFQHNGQRIKHEWELLLPFHKTDRGDMLQGKAERRGLKKTYEWLRGAELWYDEDDEAEPETGLVETRMLISDFAVGEVLEGIAKSTSLVQLARNVEEYKEYCGQDQEKLNWLIKQHREKEKELRK